ncbi:DUF4397 domain-containing protein [Pseudomonadales bacterium]|nr:DUF4397 domain-containing protein [Pseudomonadales bacterium]
MKRTLFLTAYLACLLVITGCGEDPGYDKFAPSPSGSIRYVNAVTDAPSLVVEFGTQSIGNTPFGQFSSINSVIPGLERNTQISYVKDNQLEVIATLSISVPQDQLKTLILTGTMANLSVVEVLEDLSAPTETDTTTTLRIANAAGALNDAVSLTIFDSTASETPIAELVIEPGAISDTLTVESTSSLSIQATNAGGDILWTSNDFLAATGVRPIIILVDTFGPSTSQSPLQGLYATVGGTFDFPNETFTASVRILNAVPDQTAIDLYQRSAQSSTPGIVSIEADVAASSGSYTVSVQQLAIPETYQTSSGFDATTTVIGTGTLIMTNGLTTTNVVIDEDNSSVDGITTAINTADNGDATAKVITDADGQIYLQIATLDYQESNQLSIVVDDDDENDSDASGLSQLATNQLNVITEAVSAQVTVNGTTVERSTNAIKDVINDVTLFILGISPVDTEVEVEITQQSLVAEDLFYSDVSPYFTTATGSVIFTVTIANDPSTVLFSDRFSLEKNQHHMLAISGTGDNVSARITAEEYRPVATESRLSILHAAPSASVLDVYVLKSDVTLEGGNPAGNNIVPLVTGQFGLAPESYNLTITEAESKTVLAGPENINATANGFFRYVVLDADGGGAPLQLIQLDN